uniref:Uncharacterized protein n=1 Tax=virus sp. ctmTa7 TaxID=2828255 RepID=A0A8S5RCQ1_9VIRU|nr:MAG TPA: hypothetical protein [virus sp. ctmTa7]
MYAQNRAKIFNFQSVPYYKLVLRMIYNIGHSGVQLIKDTIASIRSAWY